MLHLAEEMLLLWSLGARPRPSSMKVAKDQVLASQYKGIVMTSLESPLKVESVLVEPTPQAHPPKEPRPSEELTEA
jgi:hypothetical protein